MRRWLCWFLLLAMLAAGACSAAARVGSIRNPLIVLENAGTEDNFGGADVGAPASFRDGRNRLHVSQNGYHPMAVYVSRCGSGIYVPAAEWTVRGLGRGPYLVGAFAAGEPGPASRHFTWGPTEIRFRSRSGGRFYLRCNLSNAP